MRLAPAFVFFAALGLAVLSCKPGGDATSEPRASASPPADACGQQDDGSRRFRILHINDVYRIEGLADGRGGVARIRTLRRELEAECSALLLTHAGDTLFPSLLSREYEGAQMIEALNVLDGDAEAFDERMFITFGNHEFDKGRLEDAAVLDARVAESQFGWLGTNVSFKLGEDGQALVADEKIARSQLIELGGVRVGLFSLMTDAAVPRYVESIDTHYAEVAREAVAQLREQGAEVVLALTHLDARDDQALLEALAGREGPDLILGGHDHALMTLEAEGRAALKGDALRVRVVEVWVDAEGELGWSADPAGTALGPDTPAPDPELAAVVEARLDAFDREFCGDEGPGCLDKKLSVAGTDLIAEELEIRRYETNYGDWIVDRMLETFAADGAQIAFVNSGALRLNQDIRAGTPITRQIVEETFAYPAAMHLLEISGATLQQVVERSIQDWTGAGHWLQVGGLAFRHDVAGHRASALTWLGPEGPVAIDPEQSYRVVATDYLVDEQAGDQDGYTMLSTEQIVPSKADGTDLKQVVLEALEAAGEQGIAPQVEGRICSSDRAEGPCLATR